MKVAFLTAGGIAPCLSSTIATLIEEYNKESKNIEFYGYLHGYKGLLLGNIVAPIVMGLVFFLVVTPIGIVMRIMGKDLIRKELNKNNKSYWIKREKPIGTMKKQF